MHPDIRCSSPQRATPVQARSWTWAHDVGWFLLRLAGWYFGLLLLWPLMGGGYRATLIHMGNLLFRNRDTAREVRFIEYHAWKETDVTERADIAVLVQLDSRTEDAGAKRYILAKAVVTFSQPYTSAAFLLALTFATDRLGKRQLFRAAGATALLHLLMLGCILIDVAHATTTSDPLMDTIPGFVRVTIDFLHASVTDWPAGVFIVPLLLWLLFASPWKTIRDQAASRDAAMGMGLRLS